MEELKGLIEELLNHIDKHKESYDKPEWTNKNIVNAWFRSYDHKFKSLGLFSKQCVNEENIYRMLHEFRNWNKDWDTFMTKKPDSADDFVAMLAKKYEVTPK